MYMCRYKRRLNHSHGQVNAGDKSGRRPLHWAVLLLALFPAFCVLLYPLRAAASAPRCVCALLPFSHLVWCLAHAPCRASRRPLFRHTTQAHTINSHIIKRTNAHSHTVKHAHAPTHTYNTRTQTHTHLRTLVHAHSTHTCARARAHTHTYESRHTHTLRH